MPKKEEEKDAKMITNKNLMQTIQLLHHAFDQDIKVDLLVSKEGITLLGCESLQSAEDVADGSPNVVKFPFKQLHASLETKTYDKASYLG